MHDYLGYTQERTQVRSFIFRGALFLTAVPLCDTMKPMIFTEQDERLC